MTTASEPPVVCAVPVHVRLHTAPAHDVGPAHLPSAPAASSIVHLPAEGSGFPPALCAVAVTVTGCLPAGDHRLDSANSCGSVTFIGMVATLGGAALALFTPFVGMAVAFGATLLLLGPEAFQAKSSDE